MKLEGSGYPSPLPYHVVSQRRRLLRIQIVSRWCVHMPYLQPGLPGLVDSQSIDLGNSVLLIPSLLYPFNDTPPKQDDIYRRSVLAGSRWSVLWMSISRLVVQYMVLPFSELTLLTPLIRLNLIDLQNIINRITWQSLQPLMAAAFTEYIHTKGISNLIPTGPTARPRSHYTPNQCTLQPASCIWLSRHLLQPTS